MSDFWQRNAANFRAAEDAHLTPPESEDPPKCQACGEFPGDDFLYKYQGNWICDECLKESFPRRDIYMSDWSDIDA